jgi:hypothetical protein
MLQKKFHKVSLTALAMAAAIAYAPASSAAMTGYAQDFEGLDASNPLALGIAGGDNWKIFADVWFGPVGSTFLYSYGVFTAPNGGPGFSAIAGGEGGPAQGAQYMNIYSDYNNADHANGFTINTNVFQERTLDALDVGSGIWTLTADYKAPSSAGIANPASNATATAFIKTLDPNAGFAQTNLITFDSTTADPAIWGSFSLSIDLSDPLLVGQILQFGFNTTATNYEDSGVYYDNICFNNTGGCPTPPAVPVPAAVWLFGSGLIGLVGVARRKSSV